LGRTYRRRISRGYAQACTSIVYNSNDAGIRATGKAHHTEYRKATKRVSEIKSKKPHKPRPGTIESFSSRDMLYALIAQMRQPLAILLAKVGANGPHTLPASLLSQNSSSQLSCFLSLPHTLRANQRTRKSSISFVFISLRTLAENNGDGYPVSNRKSQALLKEIPFMVVTTNLA
jgi:hypothetical protein